MKAVVMTTTYCVKKVKSHLKDIDLRDRNTLRKPKVYEDYERNLMSSAEEDELTYRKAVTSNESKMLKKGSRRGNRSIERKRYVNCDKETKKLRTY